MKKFIHVLLINVAVITLFFAAFEVIGQAAFYAKTGRNLSKGEDTVLVKFHRDLYERHPFLGGQLKKNVDIRRDGKKVSTTADGLRWSGASDSADAVTIAVLGGSTTFGTRVSDEDSWPAILQKNLGEGYRVLNFGVPGYDSTQSLIQLMLRVSEYDPDIVVFYMGWNDIAHYHIEDLGADFEKGGIKQVETTMNISFYDYKESYMKRFFAQSAVGKFIRILLSRMVRPPEPDASAGRGDPDPFVDRIYARNLNYLKLIAGTFRSEPELIFVPQILNNSKFLEDDGAQQWSRHINNADMPRLIERFNGILAAACSENEPRCTVLQNAVSLEWSSDDFVDNGHFNRDGGVKFADAVSAAIRNLP